MKCWTACLSDPPMRKLLPIIILLFCCLQIFSQDKKDGLGIRLGIVQGVSFQHKISQAVSFEGVLAMYRYDPATFAFVQYHIPDFLNSKKVSLMFGLGFHILFVEGYKNTDWFPAYQDQQEWHIVAGVDAQLGLNYYFSEFPLNLCLEFRPAYNLLNHQGVWQGVALTVRYRF